MLHHEKIWIFVRIKRCSKLHSNLNIASLFYIRTVTNCMHENGTFSFVKTRQRNCCRKMLSCSSVIFRRKICLLPTYDNLWHVAKGLPNYYHRHQRLWLKTELKKRNWTWKISEESIILVLFWPKSKQYHMLLPRMYSWFTCTLWL